MNRINNQPVQQKQKFSEAYLKILEQQEQFLRDNAPSAQPVDISKYAVAAKSVAAPHDASWSKSERYECLIYYVDRGGRVLSENSLGPTNAEKWSTTYYRNTCDREIVVDLRPRLLGIIMPSSGEIYRVRPNQTFIGDTCHAIYKDGDDC